MRKPHASARRLRAAMPPAEALFWSRVKNGRLAGYRVRRQHTVGPYIADFACLEAMLVIELDGDQHGRGDAPVRDEARDRFLIQRGFDVVRFWNTEVFVNLDGVLETVLHRPEDRVRDPAVQALKRTPRCRRSRRSGPVLNVEYRRPLRPTLSRRPPPPRVGEELPHGPG
ncbi:MAG: DUF559 domain-containing protein [Pseudomonadota bacterium]